MSTARLPSAAITTTGERSPARSVEQAVTAVATGVVILVVSLLVLLLPVFTHWALERAGSADLLGLSRAETQAISDRTIGELVFGPGTFAFGLDGGPGFYDPAEAAHLADARQLLWAFLILGALSATGLALVFGRTGHLAWPWRAAAAGGSGLAVGLVLVGLFFLIAFDIGFELFHRIFFPQGNWAFDPGTQRIVRLYPTAFWQLAAGGLGIIGIALGALVWRLAEARARQLDRAGPSG